MKRKKLSEAEIAVALSDLEGWNVDGAILMKRFEFENFAQSLAFINQIGEIAENHDHHPDITFGWGYAEIALTTHDTGGLTEFDFAVAKAIGKI